MPTSFEDIRVLKSAEVLADTLYKISASWNEFARDVVGKQLARAADSIGANIAESFGRYHFGEKVQFLYYARGSVFETKYWLNRAASRNLLTSEALHEYAAQLTDIARQLNAFISSLKGQRSGEITVSKQVREPLADYLLHVPDDFPNILFDENDLSWLTAYSPIL